MTPDCLEHLIQLIKCPSVTPQDGGAFFILVNTLKLLGFSIEEKDFQTKNTSIVKNLYARFGTEAPHLMFAGHIDVVPPGDFNHWTYPPFSATIAEGKIYGRGIVDMKGSIACFIAAVARFIPKYKNFGSISLLITGDEEGPAINGTKKMLSWIEKKGEKWDACIVGEPTCNHIIGDTIKIGRRGSLSGEITIHGKQGHVAYPHLTENPIRGLIPLLHQLTNIGFDTGHTTFSPTNMEITTIDVGNPSKNVIPAQVKMSFNIRFNDLWNEKTLKEEIRSRLIKGIQNVPKLSHTVHFSSPVSPVFLTHDRKLTSLLSKSIYNTTGNIPLLSTSGGTSDARFIKDYCPVIEFGLVGRTMHALNENASLQDLEDLTCIYENFLQNWFITPSQ
ncbi:succinyl-diaminopimelate desuccinylase [Candidatus Liberibacter asiaticus]|uniref:succinyl-diaminopimelate desuccinylase n=1 Tax=Liberibacter asiaticus TaxID=34021 RepID=UPI0015EC4931|nr:succinyl-diaminopimelate desuccinylase [Candidatus Liberibacter asiaticus]